MARGDEAVADGRAEQGSLGAAFDPRRQIQRDPFNELVVFVVSAAGACLLVPVLLLIVGALITGELSLPLFVALSVVLELGLIFLHARPAMRLREMAAWALLWGFATAVLGAAFWELVYASVLT